MTMRGLSRRRYLGSSGDVCRSVSGRRSDSIAALAGIIPFMLKELMLVMGVQYGVSAFGRHAHHRSLPARAGGCVLII